jgi:DNA invertase Pin-like site-specific DNA recombinase
VEKDDIPMQKQYCREFAERQGWEVREEFSEKGVSGYKVSAEKRDAITKIKKDALDGKFDILLVFMFDRIGRIDSETPFVVEWLVRHGIEVWSANEGQQRFDSHVDKLMNYIRFWQAHGESEKTSIRTKTRLGQIVKEGRFRGGVTPYGYKLEKQGRINKKNHEVYEIVADEYESTVVQMIFERYINAGYGTRKIGTYLAKKGIRNREGRPFHGSSILNFLKNPLYRGVLRSGESYSEPFPHLRIVDDDTFNRAQLIIAQRGKEYNYKGNCPQTVKANALLTGMIFCGHCGSRLHVNAGNKVYTSVIDGEVIKKDYRQYVCYAKSRDKTRCDGHVTYRAHIIDGVVEDIVCEFFNKLQAIPYSQVIERQYQDRINECEVSLTKAKSLKAKYTSDLADLKAEVVNAIRGKSKWNAEILNDVIAEAEADLKDADAKVELHESELADSQRMIAELKQQYDRLLNWASIYADCDVEEKKMILTHIISRVDVRVGFQVEIEFKISIEQFLGETDSLVQMQRKNLQHASQVSSGNPGITGE